MPREATGELERLADGRFAARITIQGRRRQQFILTACPGEPEAEARKTAMAAMAARLRKAGLSGEIEKVMAMAAAARHGKPWDVVVAGVDVLCAGGSEENRLKVPPTFATFA